MWERFRLYLKGSELLFWNLKWGENSIILLINLYYLGCGPSSLWSGNMSKKKIHWCNKEVLCAPKGEGGLGYRNSRNFNLAFFSKQAWRILENPHTLWVRLLKSLYFTKVDFLDSHKGARPSWIWPSLSQAIRLGAFKVLGDGSSISVSHDPWIPWADAFKLVGPLLGDTVAADWIREDSRIWDTDLIAMDFDQSQVQAICKIPIDPVGMKDEWKWKPTTSGRFTVKFAYHTIRRHSAHIPTNGNLDLSSNWNGFGSSPFHQKLGSFVAMHQKCFGSQS